MNILLMSIIGWIAKMLVPMEGLDENDYVGRRELCGKCIVLSHSMIKGVKSLFCSLAIGRWKISSEWSYIVDEDGPLGGWGVEWRNRPIHTIYDLVRHLALEIVRRSICFQDLHNSYQEVEWTTLGPIRLRITDNTTIDHSDVELSLTVGPPIARLMIGYRWAAGEDVICDSGFFGRAVWKNQVKIFGV